MTSAPASPVRIVMPAGVHDPATPSGGNAYDRRVCAELPRLGRPVDEQTVPGGWPRPGAAALAALTRVLRESPDGSLVLLDGLVACAAPDVVVPEAESGRLRLAVLVHLPLADETGLDPDEAAALDAAERRTLRAVPTVLATSDWAAGRLVEHHGLDRRRVHVAAPGADPAPPSRGSAGEAAEAAPRLLCVASVTPRKGQYELVEALAAVSDLPWDCECVGGLGQDPAYVSRLRALIAEHGLADRVRLVGPRTPGPELDAYYDSADLLVLASHAETYGMVVTEALARGIPVLATAVGGLPEAVGRAPGGDVPGTLVRPDDRLALTAALRHWLGDPGERNRARTAAHARRDALAGWDATARGVAAALDRLREDSRETA
ncbi:glycosyltransferase family 4 protein [Streptomyces sp. NPDC127084]|uniref:glycosyltransferase family 4 protein n=1 Tax=Streptomyces sp. NPDC127084 TaxID=3347133 RepID=UPI00364EEC20